MASREQTFYPPTERNPETLQLYRKQSWWQIIFPVVLTALLMIGLVVGLFMVTRADGLSVAADYALILLLLPVIVGSLLVLAAIIALIYYASKALSSMAPYTYVAYKYMRQIHQKTDEITDQAAHQVIAFKGTVMGINLYLKERGLLTKDGAASKAGEPTMVAPNGAQKHAPDTNKQSSDHIEEVK